MAYLSLGVLGPGVDGGKELAVFSFGVATGTGGIASWKLSPCPPEPGSGRASWGLMCGVPASLGDLCSSCCTQMSKVQGGSVGCTISAPFVAW